MVRLDFDLAFWVLDLIVLFVEIELIVWLVVVSCSSREWVFVQA